MREYSEYCPKKHPLTDEEAEILARALFEEDERAFPEGCTWELLDYSYRSAYVDGACAVLSKWSELKAR